MVATAVAKVLSLKRPSPLRRHQGRETVTVCPGDEGGACWRFDGCTLHFQIVSLLYLRRLFFAYLSQGREVKGRVQNTPHHSL